MGSYHHIGVAEDQFSSAHLECVAVSSAGTVHLEAGGDVLASLHTANLSEGGFFDI